MNESYDARTCPFFAFVSNADNFYVCNWITSILNYIFILPATLGNALVIVAVWRTPALQTSSTALLMSLASSDLAVGLVAQPAFATWRITQVIGNTQFHCIFGLLSESLGWLLAGVSNLTVTAISVERYLAVYLHLRYNVIITQGRVVVLVASFWFMWIFIITLRFFVLSEFALRILAIHLIVLTSGAMLFACTKIYFTVQRHQDQIRNQARWCQQRFKENVMDMARYKKSTVTMLYVLVAFLLCYVPFLCVMIMEVIDGETEPSRLAYLVTVTIIFLNSSLNPVIYCWRIKEIRKAIFKVLTFKVVSARVVPLTTTFRQPRMLSQSPKHHVHRTSVGGLNVSAKTRRRFSN